MCLRGMDRGQQRGGAGLFWVQDLRVCDNEFFNSGSQRTKQNRNLLATECDRMYKRTCMCSDQAPPLAVMYNHSGLTLGSSLIPEVQPLRCLPPRSRLCTRITG